MKAELKESKRYSDLLKLYNLEAEVLQLKKESTQPGVNIFQNITEDARKFLSTLPEHRDAFKGTNVEEGIITSPYTQSGQEEGKERKQSIDYSANTTTQTSATHMGETISTLSGEVLTINPDSGVGGEG
jgi:hypothetical protein